MSKEEFLKKINNMEGIGSLLQELQINKALNSDKEVIMAIASVYEDSLRYASDELKKDKELALFILKKNLKCIDYLDENLTHDPDFLVSIIDNDEISGSAKEKIDKLDFYFKVSIPEFYQNEEIAQKIVSLNGRYLGFFDEKIRSNKDIVSMALNQDSKNFIYADSKIIEDKEFLKEFGISENDIEKFHMYVNENPDEILYPTKVDTFAKTVVEDDEIQSFTLDSTYHEGDIIFPITSNKIYNTDEYGDEHWTEYYLFPHLVYSGDLSQEQNLKLLKNYSENYCFNYSNFLDYHIHDLIECIGEKNYAKETLIAEGLIEDDEIITDEVEKMIKKRIFRERALSKTDLSFHRESLNPEKIRIKREKDAVPSEGKNLIKQIYRDFENLNYDELMEKYSYVMTEEERRENVISELTAQMEEKRELERQIAIKEGRINIK